MYIEKLRIRVYYKAEATLLCVQASGEMGMPPLIRTPILYRVLTERV